MIATNNLKSRRLGHQEQKMDNAWLTGDGIAESEGLGLARNDLPLNTSGFANLTAGQFISI